MSYRKEKPVYPHPLAELGEDPVDYTWVSDSMIGIVLMGCERDSRGNPMEQFMHYRVYKHKYSSKLIVLPTDKKSDKKNSREERMNKNLKQQNRLN